MKKKALYTLVIALIMMVNVLFTGCNLLVTDNTKYYEQVVATVGDYEITKFDLLNAYDSYANNYIQNGATVEQALNATLEALINREVLYKYAEEKYGDLEDWEESEVWQEVFDFVNGEIRDYVNDIRTKRDLPTITEDNRIEETTSQEETKYIFKDFESDYEQKFDANSNLVGYTKIVEDTHNRNLDLDIEDFKFTQWGASKEDKEINELAKKQFFYVLKVNNTDGETENDDLLEDHLEDVFESYVKTRYLNKVEEEFNRTTYVSVDSILDKYKELVTIDYGKYSTSKSDYISAVQSDNSTVFYHPFGAQLVRISHILIKYDVNSDDADLRAELKTKLENGEISAQEYELAISENELGKNCEVYEYQDGVLSKEIGTAKDNHGQDISNANILWQYVQEEMSNANLMNELGACDIEAKAQKFSELAYRFNQDTGLFGTEGLYAVQLDTSFQDTMVEEFANLSRELYNEQGVGSVGICYTQYGAHIVFVAGLIDNPIVKATNINNTPANLENALNNVTIEQLAKIKVRPAYSKTLLDVVVDKTYLDNFADYQNALVGQIKIDKYSEEKIEINQKAIDQLLEGAGY